MPTITLIPITPLPPLVRTDEAAFKPAVDAFFGQLLPTFSVDINGLAQQVQQLAQWASDYAAAAAGSASAAAASQASAAASAESAQSWAAVAVAGSAGLTGASTSTQTIGTGLRTFTVPAGKNWTPGLGVRAWAAPGAFMAGIVVSYSGTTLVIDMDVTRGQGTYSSWQLGVHFPEPDEAALVFAVALS